MKSIPIVLATAAALMTLGSPRGSADEVQFNAPSTVHAQLRSELLNRAARALTREEGGISNLWVYPTGGADAVFVSYRSNGADHFALIELRGERIVTRQELGAGNDWLAGS